MNVDLGAVDTEERIDQATDEISVIIADFEDLNNSDLINVRATILERAKKANRLLLPLLSKEKREQG